MSRKKLIVAFLGLLVAASVTAQHIKFHNIDINDGLSQSSINCIIQDHYGFIWIGTQDGLNLYDGYEFKHYKHDPFDTTTLSNNFINSIYESEDGSIWVGTEAGLNRFNRITHAFERYPIGLNGLSNDHVWSIIGDATGRIWIGTEGGLNQFNPTTGKWRYYNKGFDPNTIPSNVVRSIFIDSQGILWVGTGGGGLAVFNEATDNFEVFKHDSTDASGLSNDMIWSIAEDAEGIIWIGTNEGLNRLDKSTGTFEHFYSNPNNQLSLKSDIVVDVIPDANGNLWVGTAVAGLSMLKYNAGNPVFLNYQQQEEDEYSLINNLVQSLFMDESGSIWVGTNGGISRFDPIKQGFDHIIAQEEQGTKDPSVWAFFEDGEDVLWVGTRQGVSRIDRLINEYHHFEHVGNNPHRKDNNSVLSLHITSDGTIWAGAIDGLYTLEISDDLQSWEYVEVRYRADQNALNDDRVYTIVEDDAGYLWVGTKEGLARINISTRNFDFFQNDPSDPESISNNVVRGVYQDSKGRIWIGTDGGGLNLAHFSEDRVVFSRYVNDPNNPESISSDMVFSMWEDREGLIWIGTYGGGLNSFNPETGVFEHYTEKDGLSNNVVYGVLGDDQNNLWMSTNKGLSKLNLTTKSFRIYEQNDGLQSNEFNVGAYYRSNRGEMFFGGINGFNAFYADKIQDNQTPPKVLITDLLLFGESLRPGSNSPLEKSVLETEQLTLNYKQNNLTINFAALHYSYSGKNQIKYIMDGLPQDTTYVVGQRAAYYTSLDPGVYVFKVWGSNSDGVWAKEPRILTITIDPPFWETWWFRSLAIIFVLAIGYSVYLYRISTIKRQKRRLEVLVDRRTLEVRQQKEKIEAQNEELEIEKDKVEKLLLNILPEETAEELKSKGKATARNYRKVTVMFTDIRNFTHIAEDTPPQELVSKLDNYFVKFDEILVKYGVEKIKTVGDAYLCAGGLPIRNKSNPIDVVLAGLEIQRFMQQTNSELSKDEAWHLRVGIHTGPLIAGVIGLKRFAYDIWGDTVNIAQRMENSSDIDKVNVSGETYEHVAPFFDCTYRGKIPAKNKGEVDMYFVDRIKPELSIDGKGEEPNEQFWKYVNLHLYSAVHYRHAEKHILKVLEENLPENLYYHGVHHMYDVCTAAERIAHMEGITGEDLFLLKTAALYHDAGFVKQYEKNEPIGIEMAREALPKFGYTPEQVEQVAKLIRATIFPHNPQSHLEQIICDADLDYLGREDFQVISDSLKNELYEFGKIESDKQWDEMQIGFLNMHKYFTESSKRTRQPSKERHIAAIKDRVKKDEYNKKPPRV